MSKNIYNKGCSLPVGGVPNCNSDHALLVSKMIGSAYDIVKYVAMNMNTIVTVAKDLEGLDNLVENLEYLIKLSENTEELLQAAKDTILARDEVFEARDEIFTIAPDIVSQGNVPIYSTKLSVSEWDIPVGINAIRINGSNEVGDGRGGLYIDTNNGSTDTMISGDGRIWYRVQDIAVDRFQDKSITESKLNFEPVTYEEQDKSPEKRLRALNNLRGVSYEEQDLNTEQRTQARENINAASQDQMDKAVLIEKQNLTPIHQAQARENIKSTPYVETLDKASSMVFLPGMDSISVLGAEQPLDGFGGEFIRDTSNTPVSDTRFKFVDSYGNSFTKAIPKAFQKYGKIVVLGSSTAAGMGTSGYTGDPSQTTNWTETPTSWVGRMRAAMGKEATIINRSKSGSNTVDSINRFWSDVAPYEPDTVVLCTGWNNEPRPAGVSPHTTARNYLTRLLKLCDLCDLINAKPIVICAQPGPWGDWSYQRTVASELINRGIIVIDFSDSLCAVGNQNIMAKYQTDSIHANDAGHARYFLDVPLFYFNKESITRPHLGDKLPLMVTSGYKVLAAPSSIRTNQGALSIVLDPEIATYNWSAGVRAYKPADIETSRGLLLNVINGPYNVSVRPSGDVWALYKESVPVILSEIPFDRVGFTNCFVSYDYGEDRLDYYHNTALIGSIQAGWAAGMSNGFGYFNCGGLGDRYRLTGWDILGFDVYRQASNAGGQPHLYEALSLNTPKMKVASASYNRSNTGIVSNLGSEPSLTLISLAGAEANPL